MLFLMLMRRTRRKKDFSRIANVIRITSCFRLGARRIKRGGRSGSSSLGSGLMCRELENQTISNGTTLELRSEKG